MKCKTIYVRFAIGFACLLVFAPSFLFGQTSPERNYIFTRWQQSKWTPDAKTLKTWRSQQKSTLYRKMAALPDSIKTKLTARAQQALSYTWPALRASNYLEFKNTGNRSNFEAVQKERRTALCNLVMGYLVSGDKKYLPSIVDGLWATLEESTWVLPAHVGAQKAGTNLPDPTEEIVDLVNGETAASVAAIQLLLKDELGQTSPIINQRIHYELNKRIVVPYLQRTDFWWMGFGQRIPNNWNPWINANVLTVMLYTAQNADTVNLVLNKLCKSVDKFVNGYGDDGACDEGPSYWSEAGGKLIQFLQLLKSVSAGRLDVSDKELLHNIGTYIYKTHISGNYVVNFADATPRAIPEPNAVYAFGEYFNDDTLKRFAAYLSSLQPNNFSLSNVNNFLHSVDVFQELYTTQKQEALPAFSWLPSTQVLTVRSKAGSSKGLFVAVQGGHNDESHNHNDVGNFMVYVDSDPVIVDAGVGTYTATTFSDKRYTLWNMQSQWHNCPLMNGVMQKEGKQYKASEVVLKQTAGNTALSMNLGNAYPAEAAVKSWKRTYTFQQAKNLFTIDEEFDLTAWKDTTRINLMTPCEVKQEKENVLLLVEKGGKSLARLVYDNQNLDWQIEKKAMDDARLKNSWGEGLNRLSFVVKNKMQKGKLQFQFSPIQ